MLTWLCRTFPSLLGLWLAVGYALLLVGGLIWFVCFPLTAYTLFAGHEFPLAYFGVPIPEDVALAYYLPAEMRGPLAGVCAAFTLYGLFPIYFNVRKLRRLRLGQN